MAKQQANTHKGKKSPITANDGRITASTSVIPPFRDKDDPNLKLDARKIKSSGGAIDIELTGRGPNSATKRHGSVDGTLLVTLTDPVITVPLDVTYVDDPALVARPKSKPKRKSSKSTKKTARTSASKSRPKKK